jgi:ubiquinone biosynthesis accessory factor UbiK
MPSSRCPCYTRRMNNPNFIDDIAARIRGLIDQGPAADLDKNVRTLLTGFFNRLDLVTREEYDVQREVLLRTREKLAQLEAKVAELERRQQQ